MIHSVTFSRPESSVEEKLDRPYKKIKAKLDTASNNEVRFFMEMFTEKQVFHKRITYSEMESFIEEHAGISFKTCVVRTDDTEITYMANKKGKITKLTKKIEPTKSEPSAVNNSLQGAAGRILMADSKKKNYLLQEGIPVPFLIRLGIMTTEGKVINSRYDKFRQINRFLEFIDDILPEFNEYKKISKPVRIADFGSGKSYLTFAVHYFLTEIKHIPCFIEGLDLKKDVIDYCNRLVNELNLKNITFSVGNIADYSGKENPDIVITLHACDTATDFALKYAVSRGAKVILSVPCCQHEINAQLQKSKTSDKVFSPLLKYGIIREKFSSLVTDALRAQWLEEQGYNVQMLEFIDIEHTPKNILIRATFPSVPGRKPKDVVAENSVWSEKGKDIPLLATSLGIHPEIFS
ncbi:MAG: SAM-dependent methyltransferase [Treponema sp.]|nr:SAM-dependent methyltransferase [Treponema sp.]